MTHSETEFAEQMMIDLVRQGYSGNDLQEQFRKEVEQIHSAVKTILTEAKKAAASEAAYVSYRDVFGGVDER